MNAKFGGFQTSPKLRLLPDLVVAVIRRLVWVLLVVVGEVSHEVAKAISEGIDILIHSLESVVALPNALVELQKFLIRDAVEPLLLIRPWVPGSFLFLLLFFPSMIMLLLLFLLLFFSFFLFFRVR